MKFENSPLANPLLVALDFSSAEEAVRHAERLAPWVGGFKIGLELLMGPGPAVVAAVRYLGKPLFVDAKLHDIPATVKGAARHLGMLGARWVTVHAGGGAAMIDAAVAGLAEGARGNQAGILAVSVLTSLDAAGLSSVGLGGSVGRQVARMARLAASAGAEGIVCPVKELGDVHQVAPGLLRVSPGIRPGGSLQDDQVRAATPSEAIARGADLIVVGRPVTRAADPVKAAKAILSEVALARGGRPQGVSAPVV
ncbi:MAG: orotidine-5'-phosphate decarboxylase [Actinomycetota bacterium]